MTEYRLISSDSHVTMPDEAWQEYLDPEFRDRAPRIERTDEGDFRVFEGKRTPIMTLDNLAGKKPEEFTLNVRKLEDQRAGAGDPVERIKDMDTDGVDAEVLYVGGPLLSPDPALRLNSVRGLQPLAVRLRVARARPPARHGGDPDRHARSGRPRRSASRPRSPGSPAATSRCSRPRATTATRSGTRCGRRSATPACRSGCTSVAVGRARRSSSIYESAPRFMTGLVMSKLTMAESVSELIHGLVMQRYPDLKFIAVEGQIGWISFFQYYSDHLWEKHRFWTKSELEEPPSHYFQRQVFAHVHGGPGRACASVTTSGSTTSCGRATTRTPRPRGRTPRRSPTSGSRPSATRTRPRSSGRTAPSSTAWRRTRDDDHGRDPVDRHAREAAFRAEVRAFLDAQLHAEAGAQPVGDHVPHVGEDADEAFDRGRAGSARATTRA